MFVQRDVPGRDATLVLSGESPDAPRRIIVTVNHSIHGASGRSIQRISGMTGRIQARPITA